MAEIESSSARKCADLLAKLDECERTREREREQHAAALRRVEQERDQALGERDARVRSLCEENARLAETLEAIRGEQTYVNVSRPTIDTVAEMANEQRTL